MWVLDLCNLAWLTFWLDDMIWNAVARQTKERCHLCWTLCVERDVKICVWCHVKLYFIRNGNWFYFNEFSTLSSSYLTPGVADELIIVYGGSKKSLLSFTWNCDDNDDDDGTKSEEGVFVHEPWKSNKSQLNVILTF